MIGIIGLGFVGSAMYNSFFKKNIVVRTYDKFKKSNNKLEILKTDVVFLCLPTPLNEKEKTYNMDAINENCEWLITNNYQGIVVIKSTIIPETTDNLCKKYQLKFIHNPEFLTTRTAEVDFHNQRHIVLGRSLNSIDGDLEYLHSFYSNNYPKAKISVCLAKESESMKIFCNSYYASKVMLFNEYYLLCKINGVDMGIVKDMMLKNDWINPMHTDVPGPDGKLGYGGACFPKDTEALNQYMISKNSENGVLKSVIDCCDKIREK